MVSSTFTAYNQGAKRETFGTVARNCCSGKPNCDSGRRVGRNKDWSSGNGNVECIRLGWQLPHPQSCPRERGVPSPAEQLLLDVVGTPLSMGRVAVESLFAQGSSIDVF